MIETPAAAVTADLIAAEADFLSIGTNDLTQYVLAMDRGNPELAARIDALHPAVLRMIDQTREGAAQAPALGRRLRGAGLGPRRRAGAGRAGRHRAVGHGRDRAGGEGPGPHR